MTTPSTSSYIFVTGASGFIGSHVLAQLLEGGYRVRVNVRPNKASAVRRVHPSAGSNLDIVEIEDMSTGDFTAAFKDVDALIHIATPIYTASGTVSAETIYQGALAGMENVIGSAIKAGVKRIIYTSTGGTLMSADFKSAFQPEPLTEHSWGNTTLADLDISKQSPDFVYFVAKAIAENRVWELSEQHPEVDFIAVLPPFTLGPWLKNHITGPPSSAYLGSNDYTYRLINGGKYPDMPLRNWADVRDVARVHVLALKSTVPIAKGRRKRLLVEGGKGDWEKAAEAIRRERPELAARLPGPDEVPTKMSLAPFDLSLTEEVTGLKREEFIPLDKSLIETIDQLVELEGGARGKQ